MFGVGVGVGDVLMDYVEVVCDFVDGGGLWLVGWGKGYGGFWCVILLWDELYIGIG